MTIERSLTLRRVLRFSLPGVLATGLLAGVAAQSAPAEAPANVLPSINLQLSPWTAIAHEKGFFKEAFDAIGTRQVNLVPAGAAELLGAEAAAVGGGAIAIAQRMIYPATVHRANGLDGVIIWSSGPSNEHRAPILARAGNDKVNSVADLEGQKFGSSRNSCYWSSPFEQAAVAGVPFDTRERQGRVRYESIDNGAVAISAVLSGATAATTAHLTSNAFTGAWLAGQLKVIGQSPKDGVYVNHAGRVTYFARRDFAEKYPLAVKAFLEARERTLQWTAAHLDEAADIVAKRTRVPVNVAKFQIENEGQFHFMDGERNADSVRESIKTFQKWYVANGDDILSQRSLEDAQVDAFVDGRFFAGGQYSVYN